MRLNCRTDIAAMLVFDPEKRIGIKEVLNHPFIRGQGGNTASMRSLAKGVELVNTSVMEAQMSRLGL